MEELAQAARTLRSSIGKCEKAQAKLKEGSPQKKWVDRQLEAFYIAVSLIENSLDEERQTAGQYLESALRNSLETYELLVGKCEKWFKDLIYESNRGNDAFFVSTVEEAVKKLENAT